MAGIDVAVYAYPWPVRRWWGRRETWWQLSMWIGEDEVGWTQARSRKEAQEMVADWLRLERGVEDGPYDIEFIWQDEELADN